jgi:uncharacterized protein
MIVIDGYNLLHALGFLAGKVSSRGLEAARLRLQDMLIAGLGPQSRQTTIVYDSKHGRTVGEDEYQGLRILFSGAGQEADDVIEDILARNPAAEGLIVVSNDHRLQSAARRKRAQGMTCDEFLDYLEAKARKPLEKGQSPPEKGAPPTDEETKRWLREFAGFERDPEIKEALENYDFRQDP